MLRSAKELVGYVLNAEDGEIGRCKDFLMDEDQWTVRYMVADTGKWLPGRKVLVSPISLGSPDWASRLFPVGLTKEQVERSPDLDEDAPVSRRFESKWFSYHGYPYYWEYEGVWAGGMNPGALIAETQARETALKEEESDESHLRSMHELLGYHIAAKDGEIGHVDDFVIDDDTWMVRYMVVDTRNWIPGKKVLVAPSWVDSVDWGEREARVDLTRAEVENSPEFNPSDPVNREYEVRLYDFYGRPKYWQREG
jgi:sporulation protein YlmC with PRC-barrel domain